MIKKQKALWSAIVAQIADLIQTKLIATIVMLSCVGIVMLVALHTVLAATDILVA